MARQRSYQRHAIPTPGALEARLFDVRSLSLELTKPLSPEDMTVQAMDDASPTKWHLAHVTWFFETFILAKHLPAIAPSIPTLAPSQWPRTYDD